MEITTVTAELTRILEGLEKQIDQERTFRQDSEEVSIKRSVLQDFLWWIQRQDSGGPLLIEGSWSGNRYHLIGKPILEGINRYVLRHQPVGHFLTAVLTNDLRSAVGRADPDNQLLIHDIVGYCYNEIPGCCQGSAEKYKAWVEMDPDKWPEITVPETDKEVKRQNAAGIWNFTQYKEVQR